MVTNIYVVEKLARQRMMEDQRMAQQQGELHLAYPQHRRVPQAATSLLRHLRGIFYVMARGLGRAHGTAAQARRVRP